MAKQTFSVGQVLTAAQMTSLQQTAMGGGAASNKTANYVLVAADAGTTISMTSTSATTITVNTGLFSAGDTVFIQNLGSATCTITAGTATVNTAGSLILPQYDAGILYFVSASSAIFYDYIQVGATSPLTTKGDLYGFSTSDARIPIGADGTILTADSTESLGLKWATPAGGGGMTLLATLTLTGSSVSSGTISSSYKQLFMWFKGVYFAAPQDLNVRFNGDTGSNYYYRNSVGAGSGGDAVLSYQGYGSSSWRVSSADDVSGDINVANCFLTVMKPSDTNYVFGSASAMRNNAGTLANWDTTAVYNSSAAITSVTVLTGSTFSGGVVEIYGVN